MSQFLGYRCSICHKEILPNSIVYTCPNCGGNLDILLDYKNIQTKYQIEDITSRTDFSLWRYLPLLPVEDPGGVGTPLRSAGWTPLYTPQQLTESWGCRVSGLKTRGVTPRPLSKIVPVQWL